MRRPVAATTSTSPAGLGAAAGPRVRWLVQVWAPGRPTGAPGDGWLLGTTPWTLGREPGPGGIELADGSVSRRHAELSYQPSLGVFQVNDLGSKNGTGVDGGLLSAGEVEHLHDNAVLRLGDSLFVYSELSVPRGMPTRPPEPGSSLRRAPVEALADRAAPSDLPILVLGPTGAGKELLAERIHARSGRPGRLVAVNCAGLNRDLLGSELFGHVRGAFSGATVSRKGLFSEAHCGTLFLDEVAELPPAQQAALLRAVQDKRIRPVGADRDHAVDVRIVAATHQDLEALQQDGRFREDLLGRLAGVTLELPSLALRRVEVLPLFGHFIGAEAPPLTLEAAEALLLYDWPRNVRELMQAAKALKLFAADVDCLDLPLLPTAVQRRARRAPSARDGEAPNARQLVDLLRAHRGNVAAVARALGLHRQQLYRQLERHGLEAGEFRRDG